MTTQYNTDALKYISSTENVPFFQLSAVTRIAERYATDQPTIPKITWNEHDGYASMYYNNGRISIDGLARLALKLEDEAWELLETKVLLGANIPCLGDALDPDATNYVDLMSSLRMGYSFFRDPANDVLTSKSTTGYIIRHIMSTPDLKIRFFGVDGKTPNVAAFEEWMKDVSVLVLKLLALVYITSGAPTRGTEVCGSTIVNNQKSGLRNTFFTYGRIMLVQFYHKSGGIHRDRYLARFMPKPLSRLFVILLCVVRPVERYCTRIIHANNHEIREKQLGNYDLYLFVRQGKIATSEQLSQLLAKKTNEMLGVSVSLNPFRHIMIAFMSTRLQHFININAIDSTHDYDIPVELARGRPAVTDTASSVLFHHQGSHTIRVANRTYAFSNSDFAFLGRGNMLNFFLCSLEHQKMIGMSK